MENKLATVYDAISKLGITSELPSNKCITVEELNSMLPTLPFLEFNKNSNTAIILCGSSDYYDLKINSKYLSDIGIASSANGVIISKEYEMPSNGLQINSNSNRIYDAVVFDASGSNWTIYGRHSNTGTDSIIIPKGTTGKTVIISAHQNY